MLANKVMGATSAAADINYIEDAFSTYLYTGNGATQTINNGIDLAGEGGLVWIKDRTTGFSHRLFDTVRGATNSINTGATTEQIAYATSLTAFTSSGFSLGDFTNTNTSGDKFASWTFRKQPKFFDIVTYTGDGVAGRQIAHSLGVTPGMIIIKCTSNEYNWYVYHRSLGANQELRLSTTDAATTGAFFPTTPTSSDFYVKADGGVNGSGETYVAYLFAHNAGGFGLSGNENVVSCGSYVGNGTGNNPVTLGYEPQWVMIKNTQDATQWPIIDTMRGMSNTTVDADKILFANLSSAESSSSTDTHVYPTATGFVLNSASGNYNNSGQTYIYIAIRRGPMKVPTLGTTVYNAIARDGTGAVAQITGVGFPPDLVIPKPRNNLGSTATFDRLRGALRALTTNSTGAEFNAPNSLTSFNMDGVSVSSDIEGLINTAFSYTYINWCFRRAPSFFDEVCYTGTGNPLTLNHNLGVAPELILYKSRSNAQYWLAQSSALASVTDSYLLPNYDSAAGNIGGLWRTPSATTFGIALSGNVTGANVSSQTYVAYLFATCAGVSKVFSFTGNGSSQTIDCGFTAGARFILIKCTSTTGDWYVWDTARGIVANSDPHLSLNTTAAEVTTDDTIDPASSGFIVNQVAATNVNVNGATYIGLAIS